MPLPLSSALKRLGACGLLSLLPGIVLGQGNFAAQGQEYPIAGLLRGSQVFPNIALKATGGYLIWQDNATDGEGSGVSARRLDANLTAGFGAFRVNEQGAGDQENAKVSLLNNGGAVFVWQGGSSGSQDIFARIVGSSGTFLTGDIRVNTFTLEQQMTPAVATLAGGDVLIVWSSYAQDGSMQGVFGQRFSPSGQKIGAEFQVNQYASFNQRTPSVAGLKDGGFVVAWVSEQRRFQNSIDIYARVFGSGGATGNELLVNTTTNICANPIVEDLPTGGFVAAWSQRDIGVRENEWDVFMRSFAANAQPTTAAIKINTHVGGSHFAPQVAAADGNSLVVWTSVGQDGSREGVFGRLMGLDGTPGSAEFQVNTQTASQQMHPTVGSDGAGRFAVVWASYAGSASSFDLFAQRYSALVIRPAAPFVSALSSSRLSVTWPSAEAANLAGYELYLDGSAEAIAVSGNLFSVGSLAPSSTHSFRLTYRYVDGGRSPLSESVSGTTFASDENLNGLPDDWEAAHWGNDSSKWPDPRNDDDGDFASNLQEFLAGTNPREARSVLSTSIRPTEQGNFLQWNTQAGFVYQVQTKRELTADWVDLGAPRFAAGASDSMLIEGSDNPAYYRVKRLR
jgi:hypothetical protein